MVAALIISMASHSTAISHYYPVGAHTQSVDHELVEALTPPRLSMLEGGFQTYEVALRELELGPSLSRHDARDRV